eukprot:TRINITY_DN6843_c0_g1_i1.p1 TRINITY_DN6843_c0_g1~~TRINITY_DN6843_c0_g1_i1.p1  ORF type:complete len:622 (-),score=70.75 TRINITY_DN6843_c0_g1_i1:23-1888(-)
MVGHKAPPEALSRLPKEDLVNIAWGLCSSNTDYLVAAASAVGITLAPPASTISSLGFTPFCGNSHNTEPPGVDSSAWEALAGTGGGLQMILTREGKKRLKPHLRCGVPNAFRADLWQHAVHASELLTERPRLFKHALLATFPWIQDVDGDTYAERLSGFAPRLVPYFGGPEPFKVIPLTESGIRFAKVLLCMAAQNHADVDYCPCLPTIVAVLLLYLPEHTAYSVLRCLLKTSQKAVHVLSVVQKTPQAPSFHPHYPLSKKGEQLLALTFAVLVRRKLLVAITRNLIHLQPDLTVVFQYWCSTLFTTVLPLSAALRIFDIFLFEGVKVLFRVGIAIIKHFNYAQCGTKEELMAALMRPLEIDPTEIFASAFSLHLRRQEISDIIDGLRQGAAASAGFLQATNVYRDGLYFRPAIRESSSILSTADDWEILFSYLPASVAPAFYIAFSTVQHGFSLSSLYSNCRGIGSAILLIKALPHKDTALATYSANPVVFGAVLSHPPTITNAWYGNSNCVLFVLRPVERKFSWSGFAEERPKEEDTTGTPTEVDPLSDDERESFQVEQHEKCFLLGRRNYFRVGDGPGVEVDRYLQTGSTGASRTYASAPLCCSATFDIAAVEVYATS